MTEPAIAEQPETLVITLRKPVEIGSESWGELHLREPTADEWSRITKKEGFDSDILAVSLISGVPEGAVRKIGLRDVNKGAKFIAGFFD